MRTSNAVLSLPPRVVDGDFTGWLRDAMRSRRMSARMVGMRTGINHSTITRLLHGDRQPTMATLIRLLRLFGAEAAPRRTSGSGVSHQPPDLTLL